MRYRYTGPDEVRELAIPGAFIQFPRMKWVDPASAAQEAGVDPRHLEVILPNLGEDWQAEGPVKAARTRKRNAAEADQQADAVDAVEDETPVEPDEESA